MVCGLLYPSREDRGHEHYNEQKIPRAWPDVFSAARPCYAGCAGYFFRRRHLIGWYCSTSSARVRTAHLPWAWLYVAARLLGLRSRRLLLGSRSLGDCTLRRRAVD